MANKIFLSAVTSEFGELREQFALRLRKLGYQPVLQEEIGPRADAETTLERLLRELDECEWAIFIVGFHAGALPAEYETRACRQWLPEGWQKATYTQWEYFLWTRPSDDNESDPFNGLVFLLKREATSPGQPPDLRDLQERFREYLVDVRGADRREFDFSLASVADVADTLEGYFPRQPNAKPVWVTRQTLRSDFVGREEDMVRIRQNGLDGESTGLRKLWLHGIPAVGKTQLATEFAVRCKSEFSAILTISGERPADLLASYCKLTEPNILNCSVHANPELEPRQLAVNDWLGGNPRWCLIIDNVDSPEAAEAVKELLLRLEGCLGLVLITGRFYRNDPGYAPIEVAPIDPTAGAEYLLQRTAGKRLFMPGEDAAAVRLAAKLGGHCKALELCASCICEKHLSFNQYITMLEEHEGCLPGEEGDVLKAAFGATLTGISFNARVILNAIATIAPSPLRTSQVSQIAEFCHDIAAILDLDLPADDQADRGPLVDRAIRELDQFSLLSFNPGDGTLDMHRQLRSIVRAALNEEQKCELAETALHWLSYCVPEGVMTDRGLELGEYRELEVLVPHLVYLRESVLPDFEWEIVDRVIDFFHAVTTSFDRDNLAKEFEDGSRQIVQAECIDPKIRRREWGDLCQRIEDLWEKHKRRRMAYKSAATSSRMDPEALESHMCDTFLQQIEFDSLIGKCLWAMAECARQLGDPRLEISDVEGALSRFGLPESLTRVFETRVRALDRALENASERNKYAELVRDCTEQSPEVRPALKRLMELYCAEEKFELAAQLKDILKLAFPATYNANEASE